MRAHLHRHVLLLPALTVLAGGAAACTGILGLDQTSLRSEDGGADATTDAETDGPSTDVAPQGDATGHPDADASVANDAAAPDASVTNDGGNDGAAPDASGQDAAPDGPLFTTSPTTLTVAQGGTLPVTVSVQRNGASAGAFSVTFTQLPSGVASTTGTIAADAGAATVTVSATSTATVGTATASLQANGQTVASVPITVAGISGSIDPTFAGGYVVGTQSGGWFTAVAVDTQGRVVAGGQVSGAWLLRRYLQDGSDDTTFDTNAAAVIPSSGAGISALAIDPATGNIVLVGGNNGTQITIVVLTSSGTASGAFNGGVPYASTPVWSQSSTGQGVALSGQKLFAVGSSTEGTSVAAISGPLGESDTMPPSNPFDTSGAPSGSTYAAAAVDPSGRYVAAGTGQQSGAHILLGRYTATGAVDSTFGDAGAPFIEGVFACSGAALTVRPKSGTIFVGGFDQQSGDLNGCFGEWSPSGANLYWKLGTAGGGGPFTYGGAAPMGDAQDRIYMVGSGGDTNARSAELDRVMTDGTFDPTFGGTGQVGLDPGGSPPAFYFTLHAVAVGPDGRIVVAGMRTNASGSFPVVGRFWP